MFGLLKRVFSGSPSSSKSAKSRLHFVLVQDRAGLSPEEMSGFRNELLAVIENYFSIDKEKFTITYERENDTTTLVINSPVLVRSEDGATRRRTLNTPKKTTPAPRSGSSLPPHQQSSRNRRRRRRADVANS